eukprot:559261-Pelagomonas_calceolata.AAC.6
MKFLSDQKPGSPQRKKDRGYGGYFATARIHRVRFYNASLRSNSTTLSKILQAVVKLISLPCKCWTSEFVAACTGLDRCYTFTRRFHSEQPIAIREFVQVVDLRKRLRGLNPQGVTKEDFKMEKCRVSLLL